MVLRLSMAAAIGLLVGGIGEAGAQVVEIFGPPPPIPPAVVSRDGQGGVTLRAVRINGPLVIDGILEEEPYRQIPATGDFVQQEPQEGAPATEKTEAWVMFDDRNLYVSARCWDSHPERMVLNELRRDSNNIIQNESLSIVLDTFYDRRNGFAFQTNTLGAMRDSMFTDEGNANNDWNTVWYTRSTRFDQGWTVEIAIPFKSLRYTGSGPQIWSINLRRIVRWKNERSFLSGVPASWGIGGSFKVSSAATLVGIETPARSLNLEIKPYAMSSVTTDRTGAIRRENDVSGDIGLDLKYGITRGLIADFTYNTDFAQVEADEQQVNLTRFSLFFPEKREFFLEGQGTFAFGNGRRSSGNPLANDNLPLLFFSRRIGLESGVTVPISAGGRLTGRIGPFNVGALNVQTAEEPSAGSLATNFSVFRLRRDIFRRSNVGMIATRRSPSLNGEGDNLAFGLDANLFLFENVVLSAYVAKTRTTGLSADDTSYRTDFQYSGDRYGLGLEHVLVGDGFNPEIGFVSRGNFRRSLASARFSPRPRASRVRRYIWEGSIDYTANARTSAVETTEAVGSFGVEFNNSDVFNLDYSRNFERLDESFRVGPEGVPIGRYHFQDVAGSYQLGQQRRVSGRLSAGRGSFYGGDRTQAGFTGRLDLMMRVLIEPGVSVNWIDLPQGSFTTRLLTTRGTFTFSPRTALSSLIQYNSTSHAINVNARLRWEYQPGSDLFVVYSEGRNTSLTDRTELENRGFAVKFTRMFRL